MNTHYLISLLMSKCKETKEKCRARMKKRRAFLKATLPPFVFNTEPIEGEEWRQSKSCPELEVSSEGRVRKTQTHQFVKQRWWSGYLVVPYKKEDGKNTSVLVHRLVAEAFLPNPENLPIINHKSEKPWENWVELDEDGNVIDSNLEWCTKEYNNNYGNHNALVASSKAKTVLQVTNDWDIIIRSNRMETTKLGYERHYVIDAARGYFDNHFYIDSAWFAEGDDMFDFFLQMKECFKEVKGRKLINALLTASKGASKSCNML